MELAAEEEAETERVLRALTEQVLGADRGEALLRATQALADLDLAAARAEHADWLSAKAPRLFRVDNETSGNDAAGNEARDSAALRLPGMQHPLLLQPRLPALPRGGKVGEDEEVDGWESGDDSEKAQEASEDEALEVTTPRVRTRAEATDVVPVDFCPPPDTRLVAITGPNTGGKTASLKALGLALLMARAGLHLPTNARETAAVPWTSRVLADLGDAQSLDLDGGLSTFSAHLTRLRRILAAARDTRDAVVVLLDEPGGGTDPAEGAALAAAVLRASAERSTLTVATSHYEEVKALAGGVKRDLLAPVGGEGEGEAPPPFPGAANAAVEFDTATLRPTYRLLWGTSGESNALAVARGLGLEEALAEAAERRWRRGRAADGADPDAGEDLAELASALERERGVQEVRATRALEALDRARDLHADVTRRGAARLPLRASLAVDAAAARGVAGAAEAQSVLAAVATREAIDAAADALMPDGWVLDAATGDAVPGRRRRRRRNPEDARSRDDDGVSFDSFDSIDEPAWVPRVGSTVTVRRMGGAEAEVVDVDELAGEVVVRMGSITSRAPLAGVSPVVGKY
jgi:DNA mismatch repair protein MutS2